MPFKPWSGSSIAQRIEDILDAIEALNGHIAGMDVHAFMADRKTMSAAERELQIISEALSKLVQLEANLVADGDRFEARFPDIEVYKIRGLGNMLRHEYGVISQMRLWEIITGPSLPQLKAAIEKYGPPPGT